MGISIKHWWLRMWRKLLVLARPYNLSIILAVEQVLDLISTLGGVFLCGAIEINPIVNWMIGVSPWCFVAFKLLTALMLLRIVPWIANESKKAILVWVFLALFYLAVIMSNFIQMGVYLLL